MIAKRAGIPQIVQHHLSEAAFLWRLRQRAALSAEYMLDDLVQLDARLQAHLEGLLIAVEGGWPLRAETVEDVGPGAVFASTWLWLRRGEADKVMALVEQTARQPQFYSALSTAFGWVTPASLHGIARSLLMSQSGRIKQLGIETCFAHGVHPGRFLASSLAGQDAELCMSAIRGCATLGLIDCIPVIVSLLTHDDARVRVAAAGGLLLLGDRGDGLRVMSELVESPAFSEDAATVMVCAVPVSRATELLKTLAARLEGPTLLIEAVGGNGDPCYVPWLLREMRKPLVARVAGYAVEAITDADIRRVARAKAPGGGAPGPADPADRGVDVDAQADLPWPDLAKLNQWWVHNRHRWHTGSRYLLGKPLSVAACVEVLRQGNQRQRALASRHLCLLRPGTPVFDIHAPALRQRQKLSVM